MLKNIQGNFREFLYKIIYIYLNLLEFTYILFYNIYRSEALFNKGNGKK